jgi:hypothetical protein
MSQASDGSNWDSRREQADRATAGGALVASSWIRALANAWEDDWSRAQSQTEANEGASGAEHSQGAR